MTAKAIMFQGTGSDVGKSLVVAGLCRAFVNRGLKVKPFKPQNMSNNAAVTADGGEIGRAQALQAKACGVKLHTDMNPVLLKPQSDIGSQIIVQGKMWGTAKAKDYQGLKPQLMSYVLESFERLKQDCDLVLIEGAGSAAEINLRKGDIANMGFACATNTPVVLIGDIDRGGVIAQLVGTYELLPDEERKLLAGFIINKFRGDVSLFDDGLSLISNKTQVPSIGVATYFKDAHKLPPEDAVALPSLNKGNTKRSIKIAVPVLPRISNFDDLDPLRAEPDVEVLMVPSGQALPGDADLVILPGSKATLADLQAFRDEGWDVDLSAHIRRGGQVFGICGGYQMLGKTIADPEGIEGPATKVSGLGFLNVETTMTGDKQLTEVCGSDLKSKSQVDGYHMHIGRTTGDDCQNPVFEFDGLNEGAQTCNGLISGAYIHGLFGNDAFRHAFLSRLKTREASDISYDAQVEETLDALAMHFETCLDLDQILCNAR